jgi:hypothetical protein
MTTNQLALTAFLLGLHDDSRHMDDVEEAAFASRRGEVAGEDEWESSERQESTRWSNRYEGTEPVNTDHTEWIDDRGR